MPCVTLSSGKTVCFDNNNNKFPTGGEITLFTEGNTKTGTKTTPAPPKPPGMATELSSEQLASLATYYFSMDPNLTGGAVPAAVNNRRYSDNERMLIDAGMKELYKTRGQGPMRPMTPQRIDELRSTLTPLKPIENNPQFDPGGKTKKPQYYQFGTKQITNNPSAPTIDLTEFWQEQAERQAQQKALQQGQFPISKERQLAEQARYQGDMPVAPAIVKAQERMREEAAAEKKVSKQTTPIKLTPEQEKRIQESKDLLGLKDLTALETLQQRNNQDVIDEENYRTRGDLEVAGDLLAEGIKDVGDNGLLGVVRAPFAIATGGFTGRYELPQQAIGRWANQNNHHYLRNAMVDEEGNPTLLSMAPAIAAGLAYAPAALGSLGTIGEGTELLEAGNLAYKGINRGDKAVKAVTDLAQGNYSGALGNAISLGAEFLPSSVSSSTKMGVDALSGGLKGYGQTGSFEGTTRGVFNDAVVKKAVGNVVGKQDNLISNFTKTDLRMQQAGLDPNNNILKGLVSSIPLKDTSNDQSFSDNSNAKLAQLSPKYKKGGKVKRQLISIKNKNKNKNKK